MYVLHECVCVCAFLEMLILIYAYSLYVYQLICLSVSYCNVFYDVYEYVCVYKFGGLS